MERPIAAEDDLLRDLALDSLGLTVLAVGLENRFRVKLSEEEIQNLSPMRRPIVNKPLGIAYGTGELPAMIASSRDYHAYRSLSHVPGDLIPIANTNHFTILDELRPPNSTLTRAVLAMAQYPTS